MIPLVHPQQAGEADPCLPGIPLSPVIGQVTAKGIREVAAIARPVKALTIGDEERDELHDWLRRRQMPAAERQRALFLQRRIKRGSHRRTPELVDSVREYPETYNDEPSPFVRRKTVDQVIASTARRTDRLDNETNVF